MNQQETAAVLGVLSAAWPAHPLPPETVKVYADALCDLNANDALEAARKLVKCDEWFPVAARLRAETKAITVRREPTQKALARGPRTETEKETAARFIALCRGVLKDVRA